MATSKSVASTAYVAMPVDEADQSTSYVTATSYYVIPQEPRRRKACAGGSVCCCACLAVFFLLFFLIPRQPSAEFKSLVVADDETVNGKFEFRNNNFYDVEFEDSSMKMYWLAYEAVGVTDDSCEFYYYVNNVCGIHSASLCALRIGSFSDADSFKVKSQSKKTHQLEMTSTTGQKTLFVEMAALAAAGDHQILLSRGSLEATSSVHHFGKVKVDDTFYCFE